MAIALSKTQLAVVEAGSEPFLVIAGPGAGKTTVLSARIAQLLAKTTGSHRKILGITYTNVAANNLRTKIDEPERDAAERVVISTFHGFATRVLQQHGSHIGLRTDFAIVNEIEDRLELLRRAAGRVGVPAEDISGGQEAILRLLGRLYERCLTVAEAKQVLIAPHESRHVEQLFEPYLEQSVEEGQLEFSLLVQLCNRLLLRYPPLARQLRQVYEHICVDEFQDTNEMQYRLLEILAGADPRGLMLLADQDQVIYQWNGASPSRLADARERFGLNVLLLPTSYRCPDTIVEAASRLIANNSMRFVASQYDSTKHAAPEITLRSFPDAHLEAAWLGDALMKLGASEWEQTVVLSRNRRILDKMLQGAQAKGVRCIAPVAKFDFVSAPLVMLHSMLRLANQPSRQSVLRRMVTAFYMMTGREIDADVLAAGAAEESIDVLSAFFADMLSRAKSKEFKVLATVVSDSLVPKKDFRGVSVAFFSWVASLPVSSLKVAYSDDYQEERETWEELERRHQGLKTDRVTLSEFLRQIDLEAKGKEATGCVRFMTVHGAKGLEFRNVFLAGAAEGQFPAFQAVNAGPKSPALEEERRSFFVAITRTIERLMLSYSERYFGHPAKPSRFLEEMGLSDQIGRGN